MCGGQVNGGLCQVWRVVYLLGRTLVIFLILTCIIGKEIVGTLQILHFVSFAGKVIAAMVRWPKWKPLKLTHSSGGKKELNKIP